MNFNSRRQRATNAQLEYLLDFMEKHDKLAKNRLDSSFSNKDKRDLWVKVSNTLNSEFAGAVKTPQQWMKCWNDQKSLIKIKRSKLEKEKKRTGGGPSPYSELTQTEVRMLGVIGLSSAIGNRQVPEGGLDTVEEPSSAMDLNDPLPGPSNQSYHDNAPSPSSSLPNVDSPVAPDGDENIPRNNEENANGTATRIVNNSDQNSGRPIRSRENRRRDRRMRLGNALEEANLINNHMQSQTDALQRIAASLECIATSQRIISGRQAP